MEKCLICGQEYLTIKEADSCAYQDVLLKEQWENDFWREVDSANYQT